MSDMTVLWWFTGTVLVVLSSVLLAAGLQGKEGTLRIGQVSAAEGEEEPRAQLRSVNTSNVLLGLVGILVGLAAVIIFGM